MRDVLKNGQTLADYGLDPARMTVTLSSGGPEVTGAPPLTTTLRIGEMTKPGRGPGRAEPLCPLARRHPDPRRRPGADRQPVAAPRPAALRGRPDDPGLRGPLPFPAGHRPGRARLGGRPRPARPPAARSRRALALRGPAARRARRQEPDRARDRRPGRPAGEELRRHAALGPAPLRRPPSCGRRSTAMAGTRPSRSDNRSRRPPPRPPATREYYAQLEGRSALFTVLVPRSLLDELSHAQETLRDPHVLDFDAGRGHGDHPGCAQPAAP